MIMNEIIKNIMWSGKPIIKEDKRNINNGLVNQYIKAMKKSLLSR